MPTTPRHPLNKRIPAPSRPAPTPAQLIDWTERVVLAVGTYADTMTRATLTVAEAMAPILRQIAQSAAAALATAHRQAREQARDDYTLTR